MITREQLIHIGQFNKPHGLEGEISATLDADTGFLSTGTCLVCDIDGIYVPFFVTAVRAKNEKTLLLTFEDVSTQQDASALTGKNLFALKTDFDQQADGVDEDDEELPVDYFIGFSVADGETAIGTIIDVDDTTDNVLFIVERADGSMKRIPAVDDLIDDIDFDRRSIEMNLPEGLLEL